MEIKLHILECWFDAMPKIVGEPSLLHLNAVFDLKNLLNQKVLIDSIIFLISSHNDPELRLKSVDNRVFELPPNETKNLSIHLSNKFNSESIKKFNEQKKFFIVLYYRLSEEQKRMLKFLGEKSIQIVY